MIPTPHEIEVLKAGETDIWGETTLTEILPLNGNIRSQTRVVTDSNGKEVVSNFTILFKGFVDIKTKDVIRFTEPNGEIVEMKPLQVKFMRDLDGSVAYTRVIV